MNRTGVAISTITWARSPGEEQRLMTALRVLTSSGLPVAIADRSDSPTMLKRLNSVGGCHVTVPREPTLVAQVQASVALAGAFQPSFILYTEPDKEDFFANGLAEFLRVAGQPPDAGVILAGRSAGSFESYPPAQRYCEGVVNHLCAELTGQPGDYCYGPFLFSAALLPVIAGLPSRLGWGWRIALIAAAHRAGLRVLEVTGDHHCPAEQRDETVSDRRHRLRQLSENIMGLLEAPQTA